MISGYHRPKLFTRCNSSPADTTGRAKWRGATATKDGESAAPTTITNSAPVYRRHSSSPDPCRTIKSSKPRSISWAIARPSGVGDTSTNASLSAWPSSTHSSPTRKNFKKKDNEKTKN